MLQRAWAAVIAAGIVSVPAARAQAPATRPAQPTGVVDVVKVLTTCRFARQGIREREQFAEAAEKEALAAEKKATRLLLMRDRDFKRGTPEYMRATREALKRQFDVKALRNYSRRMLHLKRGFALAEARGQMRAAVADVAEKRGFALVIEKLPEPRYPGPPSPVPRRRRLDSGPAFRTWFPLDVFRSESRTWADWVTHGVPPFVEDDNEQRPMCFWLVEPEEPAPEPAAPRTKQERVLYHREEIDLTEAVIRRMDRRHEAAEAARAARKAPATRPAPDDTKPARRDAPD